MFPRGGKTLNSTLKTDKIIRDFLLLILMSLIIELTN